MKRWIFVALIFLPISARAVINFVEVKPISLVHQGKGIVFTFQELDKNSISRLEIQRRTKCVSSGNMADIYKGSEEEYEAAVKLLSEQVAAAKPMVFGLHAYQIPSVPNGFWAINLKIFKAGKPDQLVWSVSSDMGDKLCPYSPL